MISFADLQDSPQHASGQLSGADIDALVAQMFEDACADPGVFYVAPKTVHTVTRLVAIGRRYARWKGIRRRQRRAAQRRHKRGLER